MDSNDALNHDPQVQQLDAEVSRLLARVEQLRTELGQAEEELRLYREKDMEARRAVVIRTTSDDHPTN
jgi:chromosome segregation ATPase